MPALFLYTSGENHHISHRKDICGRIKFCIIFATMTSRNTNKKVVSKTQKGRTPRAKTSDPNRNTYNDFDEIKGVLTITLTFIIIGAVIAIISFISDKWLLK